MKPAAGLSAQRLLRVVALAAVLLMIVTAVWLNRSGALPSAAHDEEDSPAGPSQHHSDRVPALSSSSKHKQPSVTKAKRRQTHRIHFITVQTAASPGWCRNIKSALQSGIDVFNLGWSQHYAHRARPKWIVDFLRAGLARSPYPAAAALSLDDVVLFSDGADTMFTGVGGATILERFEHIAAHDAGGKRDFVMFNAEANCYHQQLFQEKPWGVNKGRCIGAYKRFDPQRRTKWRYLNAGAWIGTVRAALWLFGNVSAKLDANPKLWCDQSVIGGLMLGEGPISALPPAQRLILLDTRNSIFLPTYHLRRSDVCEGAAAEAEDDADDDAGAVSPRRMKRLFGQPESLVLCHSKRAAAVLHFNGKSGAHGVEAEKRAQAHLSTRHDSVTSSSQVLLWSAKAGESVSTAQFGAHCPKFVLST